MRTRFGLLRNAFPLLRLARSRAVPPSGTPATGGRPLLSSPRSDGVSLGCSWFFCHSGEKLAGHVICSEDQCFRDRGRRKTYEFSSSEC